MGIQWRWVGDWSQCLLSICLNSFDIQFFAKEYAVFECEIADPAIFLFQNVSKQNNEVRYQLRTGGLTPFLLLLPLFGCVLFVFCQQAWVQFM